MCSSMELPYIFFIIFFFFINVYPELHKNLAMSDLLHAQTRTRLKRYQQAITHYCNLLIIRVSKKISLKCSAYFNLQVQVLTENVDLQTGGEGAKMWGWRIRMIAPIHGRDKGFQVLSADISFSFSIAFLRFKDRFIRRWRLCKEWENEWFLTSPWIAC